MFAMTDNTLSLRDCEATADGGAGNLWKAMNYAVFNVHILLERKSASWRDLIKEPHLSAKAVSLSFKERELTK